MSMNLDGKKVCHKGCYGTVTAYLENDLHQVHLGEAGNFRLWRNEFVIVDELLRVSESDLEGKPVTCAGILGVVVHWLGGKLYLVEFAGGIQIRLFRLDFVQEENPLRIEDASPEKLAALRSMMITFRYTTQRRSSDWMAFVTGEAVRWEAGWTEEEAVQKLLITRLVEYL